MKFNSKYVLKVKKINALVEKVNNKKEIHAKCQRYDEIICRF